MSWYDNFKAGLKEKLGLTEDQLKKLGEINEPEIDKKPDPPPHIPVPPGTPPGDNSAAYQEVMKQLAEIKSLYLAEVEKNKAREEELAKKVKTERDKEIAGIIESMKKEGKIAAKNEESEKMWTSLLATDFENTKKVIDGLPKGTPAPADKDQKPGANVNLTGDFKSRQDLVEAAKAEFTTV